MAAYFGLETDPPPRIDRLLVEGETVVVGEESLGILHTPGHSPGNVTLIWPGNAIVGDTVFQGSIGRTDFEGGSLDVLLDAIRSKIFALGDDTQLHPGHGPSTTVGRERTSNPFLL
jgi:glyoxylase-like metal-dependent hydrolase (beta-lactamase superfamily II)